MALGAVFFAVILLAQTARAAGARTEGLVYCPVVDAQVFVTEAGVGNPYTVVLVHGLGDHAARTWEGLMAALADRYHVVAFDLPGFGRSDKPDLLYSPALYAQVLRWLVDRTVRGPYAVVGHSLGGAVSLWYAATYPRDLERLILVDAAGVLHRSALTQHMLHQRIDAWGRELPAGPFAALKRWTSSALGRLDGLPVDVDLLLETPLTREKVLGGNPHTVASLALAQADFGPLLPLVRAPTQIIWGREDSVTPLRTGVLLAGRLPRARLSVIPGAGHVPMEDAPEELLRLVEEGLQAPPPPRRAPGPPGKRVGRCEGKARVTFTGAYAEIIATGCPDLRIVDAVTGRIDLTDSTATVETTTVRGGGIVLVGSRLVATGVEVEAREIALTATRSTVDAAGVVLAGGRAALEFDEASTALFSVSRLQAPGQDEPVHGYWKRPPPSALPDGSAVKKP